MDPGVLIFLLYVMIAHELVCGLMQYRRQAAKPHKRLMWTSGNMWYLVKSRSPEGVSDPNIDFEDVENDSFKNMFEIESEPDAECTEPSQAPQGMSLIARRYRECRDAAPERRRNYLEKEGGKDRETGKKKCINELSEREKRAKDKTKRQARARARASALLQSETPPNSSDRVCHGTWRVSSQPVRSRRRDSKKSGRIVRKA